MSDSLDTFETVPCSVCGKPFPKERADLGYDYCTNKDCVKKGFKAHTYVEIGHHKTMGEVARYDPEQTEAYLKTTGSRSR